MRKQNTKAITAVSLSAALCVAILVTFRPASRENVYLNFFLDIKRFAEDMIQEGKDLVPFEARVRAGESIAVTQDNMHLLSLEYQPRGTNMVCYQQATTGSRQRLVEMRGSRGGVFAAYDPGPKSPYSQGCPDQSLYELDANETQLRVRELAKMLKRSESPTPTTPTATDGN